MIPCIKNKCLIFSVCKNKAIICCEDLMRYIESKTRAFTEDVNNIRKHNLWLDINKDLPYVVRVFPDKNGDNIGLDTINYMSSYSSLLMRSINKEGQKFMIGDRLIPSNEEEAVWK